MKDRQAQAVWSSTSRPRYLEAAPLQDVCSQFLMDVTKLGPKNETCLEDLPAMSRIFWVVFFPFLFWECMEA